MENFMTTLWVVWSLVTVVGSVATFLCGVAWGFDARREKQADLKAESGLEPDFHYRAVPLPLPKGYMLVQRRKGEAALRNSTALLRPHR